MEKSASAKGASGVLGLKIRLGQAGVGFTVQCYTFQEIGACLISLHDQSIVRVSVIHPNLLNFSQVTF